MDRKKRDFILTTREVIFHSELSNDKFVSIRYYPIINKFICENHGLDFYKVLDNDYKIKLDKKFDSFKDVSIAIPAMVNSYARIFMHKIKLDVLNNNGKIYYSDTDSLILDRQSLNNNIIKEDIGYFKLVYNIKRAYFITNKTYCLILEDDTVIIKSKGVDNRSLTEKDFINMYLKQDKIKAIKNFSTKHLDKGSVELEKKEVILNQTLYNKRNKFLQTIKKVSG